MKNNKRELTEYHRVTLAIKAALKRQRMTYEMLAKRLKLSESGVKKILSAQDGSFQRIIQICEVLGISMQGLLEGQGEPTFEIAYTTEQQNYLLKDARAFALYWALVYERRNVKEAQNLIGINDKELFSKLRQLDQLRLLQLLPLNKVKVPPVRQIRWVGKGPLIQKLYQEWSGRFLKLVATPDSVPGQLFLIRYFRASQKTVDDLMAALRDLEVEFVRRAISEMRTEDPSLTHLRWVSAVDTRSFLE